MTVTPKLTANDGLVLRAAAIDHQGVLLISNYIVDEAILSGALIPILQEFPVSDMWFKAVVPEKVRNTPIVATLIDWLTTRFTTDPIWVPDVPMMTASEIHPG